MYKICPNKHAKFFYFTYSHHIDKLRGKIFSSTYGNKQIFI